MVLPSLQMSIFTKTDKNHVLFLNKICIKPFRKNAQNKFIKKKKFLGELSYIHPHTEGNTTSSFPQKILVQELKPPPGLETPPRAASYIYFV